MSNTEIERFSREVMGVELLPFQVEMIRAFGQGKTVVYARRMGLTTVNKVIRKYVLAAASPSKEANLDKDTK